MSELIEYTIDNNKLRTIQLSDCTNNGFPLAWNSTVTNYATINNKLQGDERMMKDVKFTGDYSIAAIHFYDTSKIYYFVSYDELAVDDYVVCDTSRGYSVGQVVAVHDKITAELNQSDIRIENITREIVCKIDITPFKTRKENRIKKARLKELLDKAIKEDDDLLLYASIAERNPKVKDLLEQYKAL